MKAEPCLPPPREKPALSNYRNYSALLMDQIHPGRTTAWKASAPRAGCATASDRPIRPLPTPSAGTSCGSAGPGHHPPLPAADGQPAPRARLAEAALENAGDHREFRPRPHHAAAAVGLGKSGDTSGRIAEQRKAEILQYLTDTPRPRPARSPGPSGCRSRAQGSTWPDLPPRGPSWPRVPTRAAATG